MSRYRTRPNASTQKRLDELKKLEKQKTRVKEKISDLVTTKRGTPRVRVDEEALRRARARKREIDAELRAARERAERAEERKKERAREKAREKKVARGHRKTAAKKPLRKTAPVTEISAKELERIREVIREEERAKDREKKRRRDLKEKSRRRLRAIQDEDYMALAEIDDISDSEAFTIIWYHTAESGAVAA